MVAPRVPQKGSGGGVGTSFKGTAAYLLHDVDHAKTDERVAWTDTHNLATEDPQMAWRIMAATASNAQDIQRAYHDATAPEGEAFKASKRSFKHVFHYSLSWRGEDEAIGLTKDDMIRAAKESLETLGGKDLQALFIAHNDTPNPHVHIMVNRVHPETGRIVAVDGQSKNKLRNWALDHERERGLIVCPQREKNAHLREAGLQHRSEKQDTARQYRDMMTARDAVKSDPKRAEKVRHQERAEDATLHREGVNLRARHRTQWDQLSRDHGFRKRLINDEADSAKKEAKRQISDAYTPKFEAQWTRQRDEVVRFQQDEQRFIGSFKNRVVAVKAILGDEARSAAERFKQTFHAIGDRGARLAALEVLHRRENAALKRTMGQETKATVRDLESARKDAIHSNYERFSGERDAIRTRQGEDLERHKTRWAERDTARVDRWKSFARETEASRDMRSAYDAAKASSVEERRRAGEDSRRQESEAGSRTANRTAKKDFKVAKGQSLAEAAKQAAEPPRTAFDKASRDDRSAPPTRDIMD